MIEIGKVNDLVVGRETDSGYYLREPESEENEFEDEDEVFMPAAMAPIRIRVNQEIRAFVYLDTQSRMIATSQIPYACVGEYAYMRVLDVEDFGAFFDWGIEKDLLVPGNEQKIKVRKHEQHLVRVCLEEETNRVYGTTKLGKYIESSEFDFAETDQVGFVPVQKTDLGYKVIINKKFIGMIYDNEIFTNIELGKAHKGIVKKIREDGLVDVALQVQGIKNLDEAKIKILEYLKESGGKSPLNDKSSPEQIKSSLAMSKKTFKSAIGMLYKDRKIQINKDGIVLTQA